MICLWLGEHNRVITFKMEQNDAEPTLVTNTCKFTVLVVDLDLQFDFRKETSETVSPVLLSLVCFYLYVATRVIVFNEQ